MFRHAHAVLNACYENSDAFDVLTPEVRTSSGDYESIAFEELEDWVNRTELPRLRYSAINNIYDQKSYNGRTITASGTSEIIRDFDALPVKEIRKPRVGIVGEILVKYSPLANNNLVELLEREGAEVEVPSLIGFILYCFYNQIHKAQEFGESRRTAWLCRTGIRMIEAFLKPVNRALEASGRFSPFVSIYRLVDYAKPVVNIGNETGEGWFLTGEMIELIHSGTGSIVCIQPFGCLPNHVVGKGVIKAIRRRHPQANIVAIDYDPGASEVNQLNRIKLMLSTAVKNASARSADEAALQAGGNNAVPESEAPVTAFASSGSAPKEEGERKTRRLTDITDNVAH